MAQQDKRQALLKAALLLFTEHGFHGTPTSKIAKEAGVATGTLFNYFKTKEELINQLYLEVKQNLKIRLSAGIGEEHTVRGKVYRMWHNSIAWALECPEELAFFSQFRSSPYISKMTREEAGQHFRVVSELIDEGQRQDILKDTPGELLFDLCTGVGQVMAVHFLEHPERFEDETYREAAFNAYWDCLKR